MKKAGLTCFFSKHVEQTQAILFLDKKNPNKGGNQ